MGKKQVDHIMEMLQEMQQCLDTDEEGVLSQKTFLEVLQNAEMCRMIADLGVDLVGLVDSADQLFNDVDRLSFDEFIELLWSQKGSRLATVSTIFDARKMLSAELHGLQGKCAAMGSKLES